MHMGQARHTNGCTGGVRAAGWRAMPPDVEPPPETAVEELRRWLDTRHIAASDRGAARQGLRLGDLLGDVVLAVVKRLERHFPPSREARDPALAGRSGPSLPRIRRSPFYRRARALQFKKSYGR